MDASARTKFGGGLIRALRVVTTDGPIAATPADDVIIVNKTAGAPTTVTLFPAPPIGSQIVVKDGRGDAATHPIAIIPAEGCIDGVASLTIGENYGLACLVYNGQQWNVI
jgi:hypothetical protein